MSSSKRNVVVSRSYDATPDVCARALVLLLKYPVCKEGDPATAPEDEREDKDALTYPHCT